MKHIYIKNKILTGCLLLLILVISSCKKFIEVSSPVTSENSGNVYTSDNTAISVLTAIYIQMSADGQGGITSLSLFPELSADHLVLNVSLNDSALPYCYRNNLSSTIRFANLNYWNSFYQFIYQTNAAIEGLSSSTTLTPSVKNQLLGEAKFMRAFFYYYLVNLYGDVPLVLSTDYKANSTLSRTVKSLVYEQVVKDLKDAQGLLSADYKDVTLRNATSERIRPNKAAATALLARVYMFTKDYANAEIQSTSLIDNNPNYSLVGLNEVFLKNSKETIWSLQPVLGDGFANTWEAQLFLLPATGPNDLFPVSLSSQLITSFDNNDQRLITWTGNVLVERKKYYYASKYKVGSATTILSEYSMVLRLAEQYLIRAEARAELGKLVGANSASSDINAIRNRAGLLPTTATTKQDLLDAILNERQKELFTEWGHRWFDLKRTGKIDEVMNLVCPTKGPGVIWQPYKALYPIPQSEINLNPGMTGQQNPGYGN